MDIITKNAHHVSRTLLGLMFFVFGLNGFLNFLPQPPMEGAAAQFIGGLAAAPYFFPMLKGLEVVIGFLLLVNRFTPLALVLLAPITVNIAAFHFFLAPALGMALTIVVLQVFTMWAYRSAYRVVLRASHEASVGELPTTVSAIA